MKLVEGRITHTDPKTGHKYGFAFRQAVWHYYEEGGDNWQGTWHPIADIPGGYRYQALFMKRDGAAYLRVTAQLDLVFGSDMNITVARSLSSDGNDGGTYTGQITTPQTIGSFQSLLVRGNGGYRQDPAVQWWALILPTD
jgi:hypothetical protein